MSLQQTERDSLVESMTPTELAEMEAILASDQRPWTPLRGPQTDAYYSEADVVGYGGAAGGGKTDLAVGLSLTQHRKVGIFRQVGTELTAVIDRFEEILGSRDGYNGQNNIWRFKRYDDVPVQVEFGAFPNTGDEKKFQGRPHDLLIFDEAAEMRESAFRFVMGWNRSVHPEQRIRAMLQFNPPTTVEGRWIVDYFGPWLDDQHPAFPVPPGELRWFASYDGRERMVDGPEPFMHNGERVIPKSRTFIPSRVSDNPYLMGTNYEAQLQALPEPLRSQMLHGDFAAGMRDDIWQVVPTAWVKAAQKRWVKLQTELKSLPEMLSVGVDIARGGEDETVIMCRHEGWWFNEPIAYAGRETPDGPSTAGLIVGHTRDRAPIHLDVIGVGAAPFDFLVQMKQQVDGVNVSMAAMGLDETGTLAFSNTRSQMWWRVRELLDPMRNYNVALPPNPRLTKDLCAPKWSVKGNKVYVQSRDEIIKKIGRSPDYGTAFALACMETPKWEVVANAMRGIDQGGKRLPVEHNPHDYAKPRRDQGDPSPFTGYRNR